MKPKLAEINAAGGIVEFIKTDAGDVCVFVGDKTAWIESGDGLFDILFTPLPEDETEKAN